MFDEPNPENAEAAWDDETRELGGSYESFRRCGDTRSSQWHAMPSWSGIGRRLSFLSSHASNLDLGSLKGIIPSPSSVILDAKRSPKSILSFWSNRAPPREKKPERAEQQRDGQEQPMPKISDQGITMRTTGSEDKNPWRQAFWREL